MFLQQESKISVTSNNLFLGVPLVEPSIGCLAKSCFFPCSYFMCLLPANFNGLLRADLPTFEEMENEAAAIKLNHCSFTESMQVMTHISLLVDFLLFCKVVWPIEDIS